ncbi:SCO family protein [Dechloromonas denitrificans]|uniref:SCO family protein n=1 Tax=Dechloromonas denitrificans TaxID=281362 RepID=UPI001CF8B2BA|nr:SCO family protein [Dechloromonas denitrificans]UCV05650.1 SCO family protein [Dechloromonas denitrificans]UCV05969.1 SCO family protein [Dechloromonas denitrificans]
MGYRLSYQRVLGLALALLALGTPAGPANAALFARTTTDLQAEVRAAAAEGKQLAVFLTLPDCPGCLEMERQVHAVPAIEKAFKRKFRTVSIDISTSDSLVDPAGRPSTPAAFAQRLRAVATPSYAFFNRDGQVLYRFTGTLDQNGFRQLADYVSSARYEQRPFVAPARQAAHATNLRLNAEPPTATVPLHPEFKLAATDGQTHRLADFRGLGVALAVGYTQCPDVCPTTLAELKAAVEALPPALKSQVQVLFATLDPERDAIPLLKDYATAFRPDGGRPILGLRGDAAETKNLIRQLQLVADKQPSASMGYTLDHTAGIFLFDADGRLLGLSPYGQPLKQLAADLASIAADASRRRQLAQH